jgi:thioesterase domain-containing protein
MAAGYVELIRAHWARGPYFLGGYSFGGSVAFEMAQQLLLKGEEVAFLAILDHTAPPVRFRGFRWTLPTVIEFMLNLPHWIRDDLFRPRTANRPGGLQTNIKALLRRMPRLAGYGQPKSGQTDVELLFDCRLLATPFRKLIEAHYQALRAYQPKLYPGHVTLFRARTRPLFRLHGDDLGWRPVAGKGLDVVPIPGNHETMLHVPHVQVLAKQLMDQLKIAQAGCKKPSKLVPVCS